MEEQELQEAWRCHSTAWQLCSEAELSRDGATFLRRWQIFSRTKRRVLPVSTAAVSWVLLAGRRWHEHTCLVTGTRQCCCKDELSWLGVPSGLEGVKVGGGTAVWGGIPCGRPTGGHLPCKSVLLEVRWEHAPELAELSEVRGHCLLEDHHLFPLRPASAPQGLDAAVPSVLVVVPSMLMVPPMLVVPSMLAVPSVLVVPSRGTAAVRWWKPPSAVLACASQQPQWPCGAPGAGATKPPWGTHPSAPRQGSGLGSVAGNPGTRPGETRVDACPAKAFAIPQGILRTAPAVAMPIFSPELQAVVGRVLASRGAWPPSFLGAGP